MKLRFSISTGMKMFGRNFSDSLKLFLSSVIITVGFAFIIFSYLGVEEEFDRLEGNFEVSLVFSPKVEESGISDFLVELKNDPGVLDIELMSPQKTKQEFMSKFRIKEKDLPVEEDFPFIAVIQLGKEYFSQSEFFNFIDEIKAEKLVKDVRYRAGFISSIISYKNQVLLFFFIGFILLILIFLILCFLASKHAFYSYRNDFDTLLSLGAGRGFALMPHFIYLIYTYIIGIALGLCLTVLIWYAVNDNFNWLNIDMGRAIIATFVVSFVFILLVSLLSTFSVSESKTSA